ncbi:DUF2806 domain-containing protein [Pantoea anthophila]|uniref:DUF2806 domain-containing protein n=1 Tax=Pantoea anthophila TaxID=470931 RepID=UPI00301CFA77
MDSEPESTLLSDVADVVIGVPEAIKKPFYKAISDLLGGIVAIPAAKLRQIAQSIDDTTAARKLSSEAMAKVAVNNIIDNEELALIAAEMYLPPMLRKAKNRLEVAKKAAEHLPTSSEGENLEKSAAPNDDWMNNFIRYAEDASSDRMRDLFGRILAGEVSRPGAFGVTTLRTLSELEQDIAEDFTYAWSLSVGDSVDYTDEWKLGVTYSRWQRLIEAGLMASSYSVRSLPHMPNPDIDIAIWQPVEADNSWLAITFRKGANVTWEHISFTRVGKQIGKILDRPNYEENMRKMANRLPRSGLIQAQLITDSMHTELLWRNPA